MKKQFDLKKWYTSHGMTQVHFAEITGYHRETIRKVVNGERPRTLKRIEKFCHDYDLLNARK